MPTTRDPNNPSTLRLVDQLAARGVALDPAWLERMIGEAHAHVQKVRAAAGMEPYEFDSADPQKRKARTDAKRARRKPQPRWSPERRADTLARANAARAKYLREMPGIGARLLSRRESQKHTRAAAARSIGISSHYLYRLETDRSQRVRVGLCARLLEYLGEGTDGSAIALRP